ncbi:carboxypeptidase T [Geodermatophilus bullaregiensis]|uniref:M14 family metallopeptidase n=1 Tax=Geodermatophilus bullaregiensis TaxID=1564160 RepID=UPI00195DF17B|nr:M14 family metallopeptidase [Geodermatophilus bullaregiensis]MBM7808256.1 carboxypeptidase T [Geodermatophilus bullaregiensis]
MASLIARVTSASTRAPLADLLTAPVGLDVWEVEPDHLVVQADEAQAARLQAMGYGVEQLQTVDPYLSAFATDAAATGYHTAASLEQDLRRLADQHPEIAELHEIGRSVEGRPLWALRIGERRGSTRKVAFLGCHHAREWISVEVPYRLAEHLLQNSSSDPVQGWLQQGEVWVAPMVNPDGHEYTQTPPNRLWRKNRRRNHDGTVGVDPNRNYGYMWGTLRNNTSSHVPADETYVGPRAFSEPEVRAVRDLVARELFGGVLTYHSYSQLILYPWGHTTEPIRDAADLGEVRDLAEEMERSIAKVHGRTYTAKQSSGLYLTAGDTTDWTYGEYDAVSLTVELRPATWEEGGFILPAEQITPCWEENRPAALEFLQRVLHRPRDGVRGDG